MLPIGLVEMSVFSFHIRIIINGYRNFSSSLTDNSMRNEKLFTMHFMLFPSEHLVCMESHN